MIQSAEARHFANIVALARMTQVYEPSQEDMANTIIATVNDTQVVAFATWQVVLDEATLLGIATAQAHQRQGIGRALLAHGERCLRQRAVRQCFLEVRASNVAAQRLYHSMGYAFISERKQYYPCEDGQRESAYIYQKHLS